MAHENRYMLPSWQVLAFPGLDPSRTCSEYSELGARFREQNKRTRKERAEMFENVCRA